MARIRGRDTSPELAAANALSHAGLKCRKHARVMRIRPDLSFPSKRVAIFIDGCQWHGCPDHYVRPRSNEEFWSAKLRINVERDIRQTASLEAIGWRVLRIWEHEIEQNLADVVRRVQRSLNVVRWRPALAFRVIQVLSSKKHPDRERWELVELRSRSASCKETRKRSPAKVNERTKNLESGN